jgi:hypothetical protein
VAMRNFWLEGRVDGRKTQISGGPQSSGGGFDLIVYQRDEGNSRAVARIMGRVVDGKLILDARTMELAANEADPNGFRVVTER